MAAVGVLALQGDFAAHAAALAEAGVQAVEVRRSRELASLDGLVLPGGESTTLLNLMGDEPWFEALQGLHAAGGALLGTCAGAILLARRVIPDQPSLGLLDAVVERNAFGRQRESFELRLQAPSIAGPLEGVFIRAPRFRDLGPGVEVLARLGGDPILVRQGNILAATFHPELAASSGLHRMFARMTKDAGSRSLAAAVPSPLHE